MKHLLIVMAVAVMMLSCSKPTERTTLSKLHVEGNVLKNADGDTVVLKGLCLSDPSKLLKNGQWQERLFAEAADWGANVVRFPVHPMWLNETGWDSIFHAMDQGIEWAKAHEMYVIMDWHSIGNLRTGQFTHAMYNTTWDETVRFWKTVAERYKDESAVAVYELFNEPTTNHDELGTCSWAEWRTMLETLIDTIRTYNPEALCLCAGFNWAYDLTDVATDPVQRPNVAYCSHPYPMKRDQPWEEQWEADYGYVAATHPLICTELGYALADEKGAHIPVIATSEYGEHITSYLDAKGASFTVWCFDPDWGPMLIKDWDFNLTDQGQFFKPYMQGQGKAKG